MRMQILVAVAFPSSNFDASFVRYWVWKTIWIRTQCESLTLSYLVRGSCYGGDECKSRSRKVISKTCAYLVLHWADGWHPIYRLYTVLSFSYRHSRTQTSSRVCIAFFEWTLCSSSRSSTSKKEKLKWNKSTVIRDFETSILRWKKSEWTRRPDHIIDIP